MKIPSGYEPHELPADYTGKLWIEGQVNRYGQACYEEGLRNVEKHFLLAAAGAAPNKQVLEELEQLKTKLAALEVQEPVMIYEGRCIFDCGDGGHQDVTMLKMIPKGAKLYRAAPAGTVLTTIIAEIEAIDCYYYGDPPHEHCPFSIREKASDIVKKHAKQLEAAPAQQEP